MKEHALVIALKSEDLWWAVEVYDLTDPDPNRLPIAEKSARDWRKAVEKALKEIDLPEGGEGEV
jgi:hypothetical protein